ncbi:MAG: ribonuclease HII, partial [Myxococcota bacterium]
FVVPGSPASGLGQEPIVKGDALSMHIAAASVLAKVSRDRTMAVCDELWPAYGFGGHKGYPTRAHKAALSKQGACPVHRRSFRW